MVAAKRTVAGARLRTARAQQRSQEKNEKRLPSKIVSLLLSGWGTLVLAIVTAVAGVAAPQIWSMVNNSLKPPVTVAVSPTDNSDDKTYALPYVPEGAEAESVATLEGFLAGGSTSVIGKSYRVAQSSRTVTVEGKSSHTVVVTGIRARILHRAPPVSGTLFAVPPPQGGGSTINIGLDLDEPAPVARSLIENQRLTDPYFRDNYVTIANGETVVFQVAAFAQKASYEWAIEVDLIVNGKHQTKVVEPPGSPFRTTAFSKHYSAVYEFDLDRRSWTHPNPAEFCRREGC